MMIHSNYYKSLSFVFGMHYFELPEGYYIRVFGGDLLPHEGQKDFGDKYLIKLYRRLESHDHDKVNHVISVGDFTVPQELGLVKFLEMVKKGVEKLVTE